MQSLDFVTRRIRRGSALLALLMAIVILMALYFIDVRAIFRPGGRTLSRSGEVLPWNEEKRLVGPTQFVQLPTPPKPTLEEDWSLTARVTREGQERGQIEMQIGADGRIEGGWTCQFTQDSREAEFSAEFKGNVDISKTYQDAQGEQPSYLYLITKGRYTETTYDRKSTQGRVNGGSIYVTGWIRPGAGAFGTLTITTDQKWHAEYAWDTGK